MQATKHLLTAFHCLLGAVFTMLGFSYAADMADASPVRAWLLRLTAAVAPALIATRVAWRAGYEAGRRSQEPAASAAHGIANSGRSLDVAIFRKK